MKKYKVNLSIGGMTFIHADRFENEGRWTRFYKGDDLVAEFATVSVLKVEQTRSLADPPTHGGRKH
jgi:hypothetical protein